MQAIGQSGEAIKLALDTLRKNKLRSGLTILGISIGISTVILISSAINGLNSNINHFVSTLGTNDLWIFHFEPFGHRPTTEELNRKKLTYEDGVAMRALPHVVAVDPELTFQDFQTGLGSVAMKAGTQNSEHDSQRGHHGRDPGSRREYERRPDVDGFRRGARHQYCRSGPRCRRGSFP